MLISSTHSRLGRSIYVSYRQKLNNLSCILCTSHHNHNRTIQSDSASVVNQMCTGHPSGFPSTTYHFLILSFSLHQHANSFGYGIGFWLRFRFRLYISKCPKVLLQTFPTYFMSVWVIFNGLLVFLERLYALKIVLPISGQLTLSHLHLFLSRSCPQQCFQRAFKRVCQSFENKSTRLKWVLRELHWIFHLRARRYRRLSIIVMLN